MVSRTCSSPQIHVTSVRSPCRSRHAARAEAAEVEIPLERFHRQVVLLDPLHQQIVIVQALAAADDLAVAFGRENVDAERAIGL